jgi:2-oxo-4-hydroxy-4-carboxy-5-ureidoimidazoline decarboxylase
MPDRLSLAAINAMDASRFTATVGRVFEHAPWVAARAAAKRPFGNREDLHRAMVAVVAAAGDEERLALVRGHPELAGKAAIAGAMTAESKTEQGGAGLDRLTQAQFQKFHELNDSYRAKFGFPFILAVKGRNAAEILTIFAQRLGNERGVELREALTQVARISGFRLADLVED